MAEERKKPDFIPDSYTMAHVPPPDPTNFWKLQLNEPRVIMVNQETMEPMLTVTVREIDGQKVSLQITASPKMKMFGQ